MTVQLSSVQDVREFVGLATLQPFPVMVEADGRKVNANSFMEMCTLDYRRPLQIDIQNPENEKTFAQAAKKFIP